jgi:hypothetical protein
MIKNKSALKLVIAKIDQVIHYYLNYSVKQLYNKVVFHIRMLNSTIIKYEIKMDTPKIDMKC